MALNLETLSVALKLDSSNFNTGMNQAQSRLDGFRDRMGRFGQSLTNFGTHMTAAVTLPLTAMFGAMIGGASDLTEAQNLVDVVYGDSADAVTDWAEANANAYGMTQSAALGTTGTLGNLFTNMGIGRDVAAGMSTELVGLSGDMASFFNVSQPAVIEAMTSAFVGEYDALQRLGIPINQAAVEQYALNNGIWDGVDALTDQERVLAVNGILWENTTNAQGDAARTANSWANMQRRVRAKLLDTAAAMGKHLLPLAESLGKRFEGLIDTFNSLSPTTQKWIVAILALAAALGPVLIIIGMMLPAIGALAAVVAFFLSPIGLVIAAVALLAYIFRDELGTAISWIVDKFNEVRVAFDVFRQMTDPVSAALKALALVFPQIAAVIEPLLDMVDNLKTAFQQFKDGNYAAAFDSLAAAAGNVWNAIKAAFALIDWGAILSALGDLAGRLGTWLYDQASAVDWGGVIGTAASAVGDITGTIVSKLGDLTVALFLWVWNAASAVPWGELIGAAAATVGDVAATIVSKIGDLATSLKNWYDNAINSVNWGGMGELVGSKIGDLTMTLAPKAAELLQGFLNKVVDPGLWAGIGMALLTMMLALPVAIGYVGMTLAPKALEFLQGFVTGLDINWYLVAMWMALLGTKVLTAVGSLIDTLTVKGVELITGLLTGAKNYWTGSVQPYLHERGAQAFASIGSLLTTIVSRGPELITGMLTGAKNYWTGSVQPYLHERGAQAFASIGSLITTLLSKGKDLINGMHAGMISKWSEAREWLAGIPGRASSAVGSLGGILKSAGASLIQGLIDGINSKIDDLQGVLSTITGMIPDFKGPPEKDAKLLFGNGVLIMQGLGRGLDAGWGDVTRQLSGYTGAIGGSVDTSAISGAGSQSRVIQIVTLEPGKWVEFLANAEAGGEFARQFGPEVAMRGGSV
jgi:hypothetical protein